MNVVINDYIVKKNIVGEYELIRIGIGVVGTFTLESDANLCKVFFEEYEKENYQFSLKLKEELHQLNEPDDPDPGGSGPSGPGQ